MAADPDGLRPRRAVVDGLGQQGEDKTSYAALR
jgi:hypothetical protein